MFSFGAAWLMLILGFARSALNSSGIYDDWDTAYTRRLRKKKIRRHWLITFALFAIAVYASYHL